MTREEEYTHEGFVYANNIFMERKCELFEVKDIAHDFVQGAIYADQHPRKGLWDANKVIEYINEVLPNYVELNYVFDEIQVNYNKFKNNFIHDLKKAMED